MTDFSILYGPFVLGADGSRSDIHLIRPLSMDFSFPTARISCRVMISTALIADKIAAEAALREAFREINVGVSVKIGDVILFSGGHDDNTGFLSRAEITSAGTEEWTEKSSMWDIDITFSLPANKDGRLGRQSAKVLVEEGPSELRRLTFSGAFTALNANSASAQYQAAVDDWISDVVAGLAPEGSFFQQETDSYEFDDENKLLTFTIVYGEVFYPESLAQLNHPAIVRQSLVFAQRDSGAARSAHYREAVPMTTINCSYRANVRKSESTDLENIYVSVVRPNLLNLFSTLGTVVIDEEHFVPDLTENTMRVIIRGWVLRSGVISADLEFRSYRNTGLVPSDAYDGNPHARELDQGLAVEVHEIKFSSASIGIAKPSIRFRPPFLVAPSYWLVEDFDNENPIVVGPAGASRRNGPTMDILLQERREIWQRFDPVKRSGSGRPTTGGVGGGEAGRTVVDDE